MQYVYKCIGCNEKFEIEAKIGTEIKIEDLDCPFCKGINIQRVWLPTTIRFVGDGFTKSINNNDNEE